MKNRDLIIMLMQQDMDYEVRVGIKIGDQEADHPVEGVKRINEGASPFILIESQRIEIKTTFELQ